MSTVTLKLLDAPQASVASKENVEDWFEFGCHLRTPSSRLAPAGQSRDLAIVTGIPSGSVTAIGISRDSSCRANRCRSIVNWGEKFTIVGKRKLRMSTGSKLKIYLGNRRGTGSLGRENSCGLVKEFDSKKWSGLAHVFQQQRCQNNTSEYMQLVRKAACRQSSFVLAFRCGWLIMLASFVAFRSRLTYSAPEIQEIGSWLTFSVTAFA